MTRTRYTLAVLAAVLCTTPIRAQFVVGMPVAIPNGIDFRYSSGSLRVRGFVPTGGATTAIVPVYPGAIGPGYFVRPTYYPYGPYYPSYSIAPYGVVDRRISVQVLAPPVVVVRRPAGPDLSGIDLDVEPASRIWGEKPALAKKSEPVREAARVEPPPIKKAPPVVPEPAKPKPEPIPESRRVADLGVEAFRKGEYNLAIRHFRHLADLMPIVARPLFLEGQALIAVGKYRDAVVIIEQGLKMHPEWPSSAFRPKADLYDNDEAVWTAHRTQLEAAHLREPNNADYRFLLGYMAWFDGRRDEAVEHFLEARALAPDAPWSAMFLKVAKK